MGATAIPTFPRAGSGWRRALITPFERAPNNNQQLTVHDGSRHGLGCENKHNQWVVYHGKTADEAQGEATACLAQGDAMAKAAADAEALCAPLSLG